MNVLVHQNNELRGRKKEKSQSKVKREKGSEDRNIEGDKLKQKKQTSVSKKRKNLNKLLWEGNQSKKASTPFTQQIFYSKGKFKAPIQINPQIKQKNRKKTQESPEKNIKIKNMNESLKTSETFQNAEAQTDENDTWEAQNNLMLNSTIKSHQQYTVLAEQVKRMLKTPLLAHMELKNKTIEDKINYHFQALKLFSEFTDDARSAIDRDHEWEELTFLLYKKYYLEHLKMKNYLKKYPIRNPFILAESNLEARDIVEHIKSGEGREQLGKIQIQNVNIEQNLRYYYNMIIEKSGGYINLLKEDSKFNNILYKELWQMLVLTQFEHTNQKRLTKMCRILQLGFLISELDHNFIASVTEAETAIFQNKQSQFIAKYRPVFQDMLLL